MTTKNSTTEECLVHELVRDAFHGPRPMENSIAVIINHSQRPTAWNVGWLTQHPDYAIA